MVSDSSALAVNIKTGSKAVSGAVRIFLQISSPSISGSMRSNITISGRSDLISSRPSAPVVAIVVRNPSFSRYSFTN